MEDKTRRKRFFEVKDLNQILFNGKVPPLQKNAFWEKSRHTSDVVAKRQLDHARRNK